MKRRCGLCALRVATSFLAIASRGIEAQAPSTDVYRVALTPGARVFNVSHRPGYDNQPSYLGSRLAWTQQTDGQTDIYWFMVDAISALTQTPESEYSAAWTPDQTGFAVIRVEKDSVQRLWKFPMRGNPPMPSHGSPSVVLTDIKPVGYFAYLDSVTLALFVLGSPNTLQIADTRTGRGVVVTTNIGRSLQHVPGTRKASFTQRINGKTTLLTVDATPRADGTFKIDTIAALPDSADYVVWRTADNVITGAGSRLLHMRIREKSGWITLADLSSQGIRRISRLALSPRGDEIAFVADEPKTP